MLEVWKRAAIAQAESDEQNNDSKKIEDLEIDNAKYSLLDIRCLLLSINQWIENSASTHELEWDSILDSFYAEFPHLSHWTTSECQAIWKFVAYGQKADSLDTNETRRKKSRPTEQPQYAPSDSEDILTHGWTEKQQKFRNSKRQKVEEVSEILHAPLLASPFIEQKRLKQSLPMHVVAQTLVPRVPMKVAPLNVKVPKPAVQPPQVQKNPVGSTNASAGKNMMRNGSEYKGSFHSSVPHRIPKTPYQFFIEKCKNTIPELRSQSVELQEMHIRRMWPAASVDIKKEMQELAKQDVVKYRAELKQLAAQDAIRSKLIAQGTGKKAPLPSNCSGKIVAKEPEHVGKLEPERDSQSLNMKPEFPADSAASNAKTPVTEKKVPDTAKKELLVSSCTEKIASKEPENPGKVDSELEINSLDTDKQIMQTDLDAAKDTRTEKKELLTPGCSEKVVANENQDIEKDVQAQSELNQESNKEIPESKKVEGAKSG